MDCNPVCESDTPIQFEVGIMPGVELDVFAHGQKHNQLAQHYFPELVSVLRRIVNTSQPSLALYDRTNHANGSCSRQVAHS